MGNRGFSRRKPVPAGAGERKNSRRRGRMTLKIKICIVIILGILIVNRFNSTAVRTAADSLRVNADYSADDIVQGVFLALEEAEQVMAEVSESVVNKDRSE